MAEMEGGRAKGCATESVPSPRVDVDSPRARVEDGPRRAEVGKRPPEPGARAWPPEMCSSCALDSQHPAASGSFQVSKMWKWGRPAKKESNVNPISSCARLFCSGIRFQGNRQSRPRRGPDIQIYFNWTPASVGALLGNMSLELWAQCPRAGKKKPGIGGENAAA